MKLAGLHKFALSALIVASAALLQPASLEARMFGQVEAGYSAYDAEGASPETKDERETFYHRYMLGYRNGGRIAKGRVGEYSYMLGYEWAAINRRNEGVTAGLPSSASVRQGHLLFSGDLKMTVPGAPIRFMAYSRDTSSNFLRDDGTVERLRGGAGNIITPMTFSLYGGTNIASGMTLDIGLLRNRRGTQFFNELPRIILDYRDIYVSNLNSEFQQHNRTSTYMGAVGKGPLWLRYSTEKYTDYLTSFAPSQSQQFNIGTVDHRLQRTWIDVTNWIRMSADGQFAKQNSNKSGIAVNSEQYDINLFTVATRDRWSARNFNYFSRSLDREDNTRISTIDMPFYLEGTVGADTDWKARFVSHDEKGSNPADTRRTMLSSLRLETFKRSPFTLSPTLSVERVSEPGSASLSVSGSVATASTRRFSDRLGLSGSYTFRYLTSETPGVKSEESYQNDLNGRVVYSVTDRLKVNYTQLFGWKKGNAGTSLTESVLNNQSLPVATITRTRDTDSEYLQSVSAGGVSWQPTARLNVSANASADLKKHKGIPLDAILSLSNNIDYVMPEYKFSARIQYSTRSYDAIRTSEWGATAAAVYTPKKNIESTVRATYSFTNDESNKTSTYAEVRQRLSYTMERGYNSRKILQLVEESSYQDGVSSVSFGSEDSSSTYKTRRNLTLLANYYPFKNLYVGASTRYSLLDPGSVNEYFYHATVGLDYNKLQAYVDYAYGRRSGTDRRVESRFSANLKKQF